MKLLFEKKRDILSIFLTISMVFCTYISGYADENNAPVFKERGRATRAIAENTPAGVNIGTPVAATDADGDTLTYTKGWIDGMAFSLDSSTGQIQTKAPLDYETKSLYSFAIFADDGNGGRRAISVTINVTDVDETTGNNAPIFKDGSSTTRSIAENTASGANIGSPIAATDADDDTLIYTLGGTDASSFSIVSTSGQLRTSAALNYETKSSYSVSVSVSDTNGGSDSIPVTINVTNVNEAPSFASSTATRSIAENTASGQNIGSPVAATDVDANTTFAYTLGGTDASSFGIVGTTGQLQTSAALNYESKNSYSVTVTASDGSLSDTTTVTISVTNVNEAPTFASNTATRSVAENTATNQNIGAAFTATDVDSGNTITYSIPATGDAAAFSIVSNTGQLKTKNALNYENDNSYTVVVTASDGTLTDTITVTISITDVNEAPTFATGATISNISATKGTAITSVTLPEATDPDANATVTYTVTPALPAGLTFTASTRLLSGTPTAVSDSTTYTYKASDGTLSDTLTFSIQVNAPANRAPTFTAGTSTTRSIAENTDSGTNIGSAVAATDADTGNTLAYTLSGTDASSFSIVSTSGQLQTSAALNYESKSSYSVTVGVSDGNGGSDSIAVTINVTNVNEAPSFASSTAARSIAENTVSGQNIGSAVSATDVDANTTLTYTLGGTDAASFSIVSTSGQLQTSAALDYETKKSYSVTVTAADGTGDGSLSTSIPVTINLTDANDAPVFTNGATTTRSIAENSVANTNIGTPVAATDQDKKPDPVNQGQLIAKDTITYSIPATGDAAAFSIDSNTGQLKTKNALNYENDNSYTVVVTASDGSLTDTITVTISVTNVNEAPTFATGATISNISATNGTAITSVTLPEATDVDANTTLTYTVTPTLPAGLTFTASTRILSGTPTAVSASATYTYTASDSALSDTLTFSIQVSAANSAPTFTDGSSTTRSIAENTDSGENIGSAVAATDADNDTLTYTLGGTDASSFSIVGTSGQLQTNAALNYESKSSYSVSVSVSDNNGGSDSIAVTINVTNVNEAPSFANSTATRSIAENTVSGQNIGSVVSATDVDANTTLTYTLGGDDAASFSIVSTSGQLQTSAALDYETKTSYSVTVTAADGTGEGSLSASIPVTINLTDANDAPVFTNGATTTRSIAENSVANTNIGTPVAATDQDKKPDPVNQGQLIAKDTITYSIPATGDAAAFSIDSNTGQLKTKNALNYENDNSYTVVVTASDGSLTDTITVTISVTNVNEAPTFATGATISNISATNGTAITSVTLPEATDPDANTTITYTVTPALPAGLTFTAATRVLSGTPTAVSDSATYTYTASDSNLSATLTFTIQVSAPANNPSANNPPTFTDGTSTTRSVAENTRSGTNIGTAVAATDGDNDTLTYTLGGTDASSFSIVSTTGQLQTSAALDRETKASYSVTITADDGRTTNNTDSIDVTISVTNVNEKPTFSTSGRVTLSVAENTAANTNIGDAFQATDPDSGDTVTYSLQRADKTSFRIDANTGQLKTHAALDYETKNSYSNLAVRATDSGGLVSSVLVTVNVTNVNDNSPVFTDGTSTTRSVAEHVALDTNVGTPVAATDADNDTLTYTIGGTDVASFYIIGTSGQLKTNAVIDYEAKSSYTVTVSVSDNNGRSDNITVTINVTDVAESPITPLSERTPQVRAEIVRMAYDVTDADDVTPAHLATISDLDLTSKSITALQAGDFDGLTSLNVLHLDSNSISDISPLSGLTTLTGLNLGYNSISDISALSGMTNLKILALHNNLVGDVSALSGMTNLKQLGLYKNLISDYGPLRTLKAANPNLVIDININNNPPVFTAGTSATRTVAERTASGTNIGAAFAATDADNHTLTYSLGGTDADSFSIVSTSGQLRTKAALDYETKASYAVTVFVSDGNSGGDSITVTINLTDVADHVPVFTEGASTTRTVAERTASGTNIGTPVAATDADNDTLRYSLSGTDAASFSIVSTSGQLQTSAVLDYETTSSYSVTVDVSDGYGESDSINVTINVTDVVDHVPVFTDGTSTTRSVAENTASGTNVGTLVGATDADNDTLTYTLGGTDAASFSIVSTSGQLQTSAALDYETTSSYSVTVDVSDGYGGSDSISVTINVTDIVEHDPVFTDGASTTRSVAERTASGTNIGTAVGATDADNDTLTYTLGGTDAASFSIVSTSGQLQTSAALDYETTSSYSVTVDVSDGYGGSDSISVTINVTDVVEHDPVFTDGDTTTRAVAENAGRGTNVGSPVAATDADNDTLTYTLSGADAASFTIVSTSGQLQTNATLDYETKSSYTVTVDVSDGYGGSDSITVTINVTDVKESTITPVKDRTTQIRDAIVAAVPGVSNADDVTEAHLAAITELDMASKSITALKAGDFSGLTGLETLYLNHTSIYAREKNSISDISPLKDLTTLTRLQLSDNPISDISALSGMTSMSELHLNNNSVSDISALSGMTSMITLYMKNNNVADVSPLSGMTLLSVLSVAGNPISDYATIRTLQSHSLWSLDISLNNNPPTFTDGTSTTRSVAENTAAGQNIGSAVSATDANNHTLSYTLGGTDADSFSIVSTSGQLQTKAALDYETKSSYTVAVTVYDGNNGGDRITVTINVTDAVGAAPSVETPPAPVLPKTTELLSNFPNPFNPETWIPYQLAKPAEVTITIYDIQGRIVRTLRLGHQFAGFYQSRSKAAHWDGRNYLGEKVATGVYFYTLKAGDYMATRKLLIRK